MNILYGLIWIIIPVIGTSVGSALVFFVKKKQSSFFKVLFYGFASGVMISASIWSLILPSIDISESQHINKCIPVSIGFFLGIILLMLLKKFTNKFEKSGKFDMLMLSVTLHNIPERNGCWSKYSRSFIRIF